jgi:hypothetical protein
VLFGCFPVMHARSAQCKRLQRVTAHIELYRARVKEKSNPRARDRWLSRCWIASPGEIFFFHLIYIKIHVASST